MVEEVKKIKRDLIGYLKAHDLSDGQDQAWHETLDISDIMFKRVNLWEAVFMHQITPLIKVNLFNTFAKSEKGKPYTHLSWAREVDCCTGGKSWKD